MSIRGLPDAMSKGVVPIALVNVFPRDLVLDTPTIVLQELSMKFGDVLLATRDQPVLRIALRQCPVIPVPEGKITEVLEGAAHHREIVQFLLDLGEIFFIVGF